MMRFCNLTRSAWTVMTVAAAVLTASDASAQLFGHPRCCPTYQEPSCVPAEPSTTPSTTPPSTTPPSTTMPSTTAPSDELASALPSLAAGVQGGRGVAFGSYIDSALIRNQLRIRYDAASDDNRPDRAEFFYAKCGCFRTASGPTRDPNAPGPPLAETSVDYQDIMAYAEWAPMARFSVFIEAPVRFLNPEVNNHTDGFADMNAGVKLALISERDQVLTFQFRTYIPTGADHRGLGTDHVSLEPALLYWQEVSKQLYMEAELRDWIPVGGTDFAGNVIRYGVGLSYFVLGEPQLPGQHVESAWSVAPTLEFVGWTVLSGKESAPDIGVKDAAGDTIVNAKMGFRLGYGDNHSLAVSYGRALTGTVWYKDIIRVEYRLAF
jgi:hypothetical protein